MEKEDTSSETTVVSQETLTPDGYVYCKDHDIFYNEQLRKDAEKRITDFPGNEEEKMLFSFSVHSCPLCIAGMTARIISMGARAESRHGFTGIGML